MSATDVLLEREGEAARLAAVVQGASAARGAVVVLEGAAGLGKTRLLRHAATLAGAAGVAVLAASGSELEHEFGFGVVRQLLERAAEDRLEGAAALAAPALGHQAQHAPQSPVDARFASLHGLYWLVANLAAEQPLLLTVDDAQWADEPSLRFLAYLARRVAELPVALVIAARPPLVGEDRAVLEAIAGEAELLAAAPLSVDGVAALAAERLGSDPEPDFVAACHRITAGNALLVEELLAELRETGAAPDPTTLVGGRATGGTAPGVERIGRRVARRLAALGDAAGPLAGAVAVLGDGVELALASGLAGLGLDAARGAAAELVAADLFEDDPSLRFRHPLIRAAVAERVAAVEVARAHGRAARLLAQRGGPPGAVAMHLLAAPPAGDPWVAETLRAAAREASGQGAPDLAATYLRRALAEPPPEPAGLLMDLGRAEHAAGTRTATERLDEAWRITSDLEVALELGTMLAEQTRWAEATAVGRAALARVGDRELELRLLALVGDCVRMDPSIEGDEPERLRALAATLDGSTAAERLVQAVAAVVTPVDSAEVHARAAELALRSMADGGRIRETGIVSNFIRAGRLDEAERVIEEVLEAARRGGFIQRHASMLSMRGWIGLERGALAAARDDLEAMLELAPAVALPAAVIASAGAMLAVVVAEQGELERAEDLLTAHGLTGELPEHQVMNLVLYFRSRVRVAQGRHADALEDALDVGRRYERLGLRRAVPPWRSTVAVLLGDGERAWALAREELELAERWGTPVARGLAFRGLGLVTGAIAMLAAAVEALEPSPHRLELARARVDLGAALRRDGRRAAAREPLRLGMDAAHACGARPLAERARTELLATGARPRRLALAGPGALTPSETRIAELAAAGLTNRQIAQELFVTTATVETHLRHAFRKLDVRTRGELPAALSR